MRLQTKPSPRTAPHAALQVVIVVEGTRGIDFLFGIIIAVVCANWIAQFVHKDGVYESELDHDGNVFFLRTEAPNALQYKVAADVSSTSRSGHFKSDFGQP